MKRSDSTSRNSASIQSSRPTSSASKWGGQFWPQPASAGFLCCPALVIQLPHSFMKSRGPRDFMKEWGSWMTRAGQHRKPAEAGCGQNWPPHLLAELVGRELWIEAEFLDVESLRFIPVQHPAQQVRHQHAAFVFVFRNPKLRDVVAGGIGHHARQVGFLVDEQADLEVARTGSSQRVGQAAFGLRHLAKVSKLQTARCRPNLSQVHTQLPVYHSRFALAAQSGQCW